jgi:hypothetical protein
MEEDVAALVCPRLSLSNDSHLTVTLPIRSCKIALFPTHSDPAVLTNVQRQWLWHVQSRM